MQDEAVAKTARILHLAALYLGLFILVVEVVGLLVAPVAVLYLWRENRQIRRELADVRNLEGAAGRRVEFWLPPEFTERRLQVKPGHVPRGGR